MAKNSQIRKPSQKKQPSRIPEQATQLNRPSSADDERPSFRFTYADKNRWVLSKWSSSEINDLIEGLKKIERYTWVQIQCHGSKKPG